MSRSRNEELPIQQVKYILTIDSSLTGEKGADPAIDTLKRWKAEGRVEIVDVNRPRPAAYGWPGAPPAPVPTDPRRRFSTMKKGSGDNTNFKIIAGILFPNRDPQKLKMSEINGVAHIAQHHKGKNEFFVTSNLEDFISGGKRERLKQTFGIIALTPSECVDLLSGLEGWS